MDKIPRKRSNSKFSKSPKGRIMKTAKLDLSEDENYTPRNALS